MQRETYSKPQEVSGLDFDAIIQNLEGYKITPSGAFNTKDSRTNFDLDRNFISVNDGEKDAVRMGLLDDGTYGMKIKGGLILEDADGNTVIDQNGISLPSLYRTKTNVQPGAYTVAAALEDVWITVPSSPMSFKLEQDSLVFLDASLQASFPSATDYAVSTRFVVDSDNYVEGKTGRSLVSISVSKFFMILLSAGDHTVSFQLKKEDLGVDDNCVIRNGRFSYIIFGK